jgi:hypothetical protein
MFGPTLANRTFKSVISRASGETKRMATKKAAQSGSLQSLLREVLRHSQSNPGAAAAHSAQKYFDSLCQEDYSAALRKYFDRVQLREILAEVREALPTLNRQVFRSTDPRRLSKTAAELGAVLRFDRFEGSDGRSLRGFYVDDKKVLERPSIWINAAREPVGVAATFWHEIGHHLTRRIFAEHRGEMVLSFETSYRQHLADPAEILADMVMVLACYPKPAAVRLFPTSEGKVPEGNITQLLSRVRPYLRSITGVIFDNRFLAQENLHPLAGVVHLAKLRAALLSEYGI